MSKKLILNTSGGVNLSIDEENKDSNRWLVANFTDYGILSPVFDPADSNLYVNTTGAFTTSSPSNDLTNWTIIGSGSHTRGITVTEDASTGVVTIGVTNTAGTVVNHTFNSGHAIKLDGETALTQRKTFEIKGTDIAVSNKDATTSLADFTGMDTKIGANTSSASTNASAITAIEAKTDLITITTEVDVTPINLNTLNDDVEAIEKALIDSKGNYLSNLFTIPAAAADWKTSSFTFQNVVISSTGAVTKGNDWAYNVTGEIHGSPVLCYDEQGATVNGVGHVYVNVGVALSIKYHSAYIDLFDKMIARTVADASLPDESRVFMVNDSNLRYSPYDQATDGSTNGITIFNYPDPTADLTKLYTITIPILSAVNSLYDLEAEFIAQVKTQGLKADYVHTDNDTLNSAKVKADIAINRLLANANKEQLSHYPKSDEVITSTLGQVLTKVVATDPGTGSDAFMTFEVVKNGVSNMEAALLIVTYPNTSPLDDFAGIHIPITVTAEDNTTGIATKIMTSFNTSTIDANLVKFRTGYAKNGITYGGYLASNSGAVVTIRSNDNGVIYNAGVAVYEQAAAFGVINLTQMGHGTGGPIEKAEFRDVPTSAPITIADTAALATFRGSGYTAGTQFVTTAADIMAPSVAAIAAQATITYPTPSTDVDYKVITGMISETDTHFFEQDLAASPANFPTRFFAGAFDAQAATITDMNATELRVRVLTTDTSGSARATAAAAAINTFNGSTRLTAVAPVTQGAAYSLNCTAVANGDKLIITANTPGAVTTLVDAETGGTTTMTLRQGADETTTTLAINSLYQVISPTQLMNLTAGTVVPVL